MAAFVVGAAVFIVSSSVMVSFVVEPPGNPGSGLEQHDLRAKASSALEVLMGTSGYPSDWDASPSKVEGVARLGLVEEGSTLRIDPQKFGALARGRFYYPSTSNGYVDYVEARKALGLSGYDFHIRSSPILHNDDGFYGTAGLTDYRVAYIGDHAGTPPSPTSASLLEAAALERLDVGFDNAARSAILGTGDVYRDDATLLKTVLVPLLGTSVAQAPISEGSGLKHDFHRVNATDFDHILPPGLLDESEKSLALARLDSRDVWQLGYTKGREIRATIGSFNTTSQSSVTLEWKEYVDTKGAGSTRDDGDYGYLEVSPDGGATWYPLTKDLAQRSQDSPTVPQPAGVWRDRTVTVSPFNCPSCLDRDDVVLAIHWVADGDGNTGYGWLIDDVRARASGSLLASEDFETPHYQLLVIGSNVDQNALTASEVKNGIRDYVQSYGGRILVLGGDANTQWLQPLFHVGMRDASGGVSSPDPTHPLLTVPNELDWRGFEAAGKVWYFGGSQDGSLFDMVVGNGNTQHVLSVSASGSFGSEGGVILTTWLPYDMNEAQRLPFLANAITYGRFHHLYMDVGPEVPGDAPVAAVSRTAVMKKSTDLDSREYVEMGFVLYLWRGNASAGLPPTSLPSAPTAFVADDGDTQVTLEWDAPDHAGDSPIKHYRLYRGTSTNTLAHVPVTLDAKATKHVDTGLRNGVTYYYRLAANNTQGEGAPTLTLAVTPAAAPGKPEAATALGGAGQIVLTWNEPATDGGAAIIGYQVFRSTQSSVDPTDTAKGGQMIAQIGATTTYTDAGLGFPFEAWYRVKAVNGRDVGPASDLVTARTYAIPEAPPKPVTVAGRDWVQLAWTPPASGETIVGYHVFAGDVTGSTAYLATVAASNTPTYTDTGLDPGQTRYYRVRAYTANTVGGLSPEASATTLRLSSEPTGVQATGGPDKVVLTWGPPSDLGGGTVQNYAVYHRPASSGTFTKIATVGPNDHAYEHKGLADNSTHYYRVAAVTEAGEGYQSSEAQARTWDVAGSPTLVGGPGGVPKTVNLVWVAPDYTGGPGAVITEYRIYRGTAPGEELYVGKSTGLAYTDASQGLETLKRYYYYVRAVTDAGEGKPSNTAEVIVV